MAKLNLPSSLVTPSSTTTSTKKKPTTATTLNIKPLKTTPEPAVATVAVPTSPVKTKAPDKEKKWYSSIIKALEVLSVPLYGTVGVVESLTGKGDKQGMWANVKDNVKQKEGWASYMRKSGMKEGKLNAALGFGLDLVVDPLNLLGIGLIGKAAKGVGYGAKGLSEVSKLKGVAKFLEKAATKENARILGSVSKKATKASFQGAGLQNEKLLSKLTNKLGKVTDVTDIKNAGTLAEKKVLFGKRLEEISDKTAESIDALRGAKTKEQLVAKYGVKRAEQIIKARDWLVYSPGKTTSKRGEEILELQKDLAGKKGASEAATNVYRDMAKGFTDSGSAVPSWLSATIKLGEKEAIGIEGELARLGSELSGETKELKNLTPWLKGKLGEDWFDTVVARNKEAFDVIEKNTVSAKKLLSSAVFTPIKTAKAFKKEGMAALDSFRDPKITAKLKKGEIFPGAVKNKKGEWVTRQWGEFGIEEVPAIGTTAKKLITKKQAKLTESITKQAASVKELDAKAKKLLDAGKEIPEVLQKEIDSAKDFLEKLNDQKLGALGGTISKSRAAKMTLDSINKIGKSYGTILGIFKMGKVPYNVGSHPRNVLTNVIFTSWDQRAANITDPKWWHAMYDAIGVLKGGKNHPKFDMFDQAFGLEQFRTGAVRDVMSTLEDLPSEALNPLGKIHKKVLKTFASEDSVFKIAHVLYRTDPKYQATAGFIGKKFPGQKILLGKTGPAQAINEANDIYLNYAAMPYLAKVLRDAPFGSAFISFQYGFMNKFGKQLLTDPAAITKPTMKFKQAIAEIDPMTDSEKEAIDKYRPWLAEPRYGKLPILQKTDPITGKKTEQFFDYRSFFPQYSFSRYSDEGIEYPIFQNPFTSIPIDLKKNENFIGKEIVPENATPEEKKKLLTRYVAEQLLPTFFPTVNKEYGVGGYFWRSLEDEGKKKYGSKTRRIMSSLGFPTQELFFWDKKPKKQPTINLK